MGDSKRITVYLDAELHKALRLKGAESDTSISDLINTAVSRFLAQDAEDLHVMDQRSSEPNLSLESVLRELRHRGKL